MIFNRLFSSRWKKSIFYLFKKYFTFAKTISSDIDSELKQVLLNHQNAFDKKPPMTAENRIQAANGGRFF